MHNFIFNFLACWFLPLSVVIGGEVAARSLSHTKLQLLTVYSQKEKKHTFETKFNTKTSKTHSDGSGAGKSISMSSTEGDLYTLGTRAEALLIFSVLGCRDKFLSTGNVMFVSCRQTWTCQSLWKKKDEKEIKYNSIFYSKKLIPVKI